MTIENHEANVQNVEETQVSAAAVAEVLSAPAHVPDDEIVELRALGELEIRAALEEFPQFYLDEDGGPTEKAYVEQAIQRVLSAGINRKEADQIAEDAAIPDGEKEKSESEQAADRNCDYIFAVLSKFGDLDVLDVFFPFGSPYPHVKISPKKAILLTATGYSVQVPYKFSADDNCIFHSEISSGTLGIAFTEEFEGTELDAEGEPGEPEGGDEGVGGNSGDDTDGSSSDDADADAGSSSDDE